MISVRFTWIHFYESVVSREYVYIQFWESEFDKWQHEKKLKFKEEH